MQDSTAQQKRHAFWLRTKKTKLEKGRCKGEDQGKFDRLSLEGQTRLYILTNRDPPPEEGNFCDDSKRAVKPQIVARYNRHMGYVDISDRMANSYSMCRRNFKWTTKLFFHLLDLTVLNSWILLSSCGAKCPAEISDFFWWGIWSKKLEEAKIAPPPVWLEGEVRLQQMLWDWTATITSTGQKNVANSAAGFAQPAASKVAPLTSVPSAMWVFGWHRVSPITNTKTNL